MSYPFTNTKAWENLALYIFISFKFKKSMFDAQVKMVGPF